MYALDLDKCQYLVPKTKLVYKITAVSLRTFKDRLHFKIKSMSEGENRLRSIRIANQ